MMISILKSWLCNDLVGLILWSDHITASTLTLTTLVAWLHPDVSRALLEVGSRHVRRGSSSSAGAKRGEIIAGVHGEGNVPLSVRTSAYSSAYHYPLKEGGNYTNRADHNWERSCTVICNWVCPLTAASIDIWIKSHQQCLRIVVFFSLSENRTAFIQRTFPSTET